MDRKIWKGEDVELLKVKFFEVEKEDDLVLHFPDRSFSSIIHKVRRLGLSRRKVWTTDEEKVLVDNYPTKTTEELILLIPRWSGIEISHKAHELKLSKTKEYRGEAQKGENNHYFGHKHDEQVKGHLKEIWAERKTKDGWKDSYSGQSHTEDTKKKMSEIKSEYYETHDAPFKDKKHKMETRLKMSHPKEWTEEGKQRIRDSVMSKPHGGYGIWTDYVRKDGRVIRLQSSYEVRLAKAMDKWGLKWEKLTMQVKIPYIDKDGKSRLHYPDFQVEDVFIFEAKSEHLIAKDVNTRLKIEAGKKVYGDKYKVFTKSSKRKPTCFSCGMNFCTT